MDTLSLFGFNLFFWFLLLLLPSSPFLSYYIPMLSTLCCLPLYLDYLLNFFLNFFFFTFSINISIIYIYIIGIFGFILFFHFRPNPPIPLLSTSAAATCAEFSSVQHSTAQHSGVGPSPPPLKMAVT